MPSPLPSRKAQKGFEGKTGKGVKSSPTGKGKPAAPAPGGPAAGGKKQQKAIGGRAEKVIRAIPTSQRAAAPAQSPHPQYIFPPQFCAATDRKREREGGGGRELTIYIMSQM